jgi:hypothetical protein
MTDKIKESPNWTLDDSKRTSTSLNFSSNGINYQFVNVDALEEWLLDSMHRARIIGDKLDLTIDLDIRQKLIEDLAQLQQAIWTGADLINELEAA